MIDFTITIDMDKKCAECRKGGAVGCGLCLKCVARAYKPKPMKSSEGRAMQERVKRQFGPHGESSKEKS